MAFKFIDNYIYLHHVDKYILLPTYPESVTDALTTNFAPTSILSRSAPIFSYVSSGPRTISVDLKLHRDMMTQVNVNNNIQMDIGDDYVDTLIKLLHSASLPKYNPHNNSVKMINPPMVSLRFGDEIYIRGVINGSITIRYSGPILEPYESANVKLSGNKYAEVDISFTISEVDPYDAESVATMGSFRGNKEATLNTKLERNIYK